MVPSLLCDDSFIKQYIESFPGKIVPCSHFVNFLECQGTRIIDPLDSDELNMAISKLQDFNQVPLSTLCTLIGFAGPLESQSRVIQMFAPLIFDTNEHPVSCDVLVHLFTGILGVYQSKKVIYLFILFI